MRATSVWCLLALLGVVGCVSDVADLPEQSQAALEAKKPSFEQVFGQGFDYDALEVIVAAI